MGLDRDVECVEIQGSGLMLRADLHAPADQPRGAFIVSHGWGSERPVDIPAALAAAGFVTVAYDLRGHGQSEGDLETASRADWLEDLLLVHFWLRGQFRDLPIGLVGASFGGYLSILATHQCDAAAVSVRVPVNFLDEDFFAPHKPRMAPEVRRLDDLRPADSAALRALREFTGPVQIIDADGDTVIPPETVTAYAAAVDPERLSRATLHEAPHHLATPELRAGYIDLLVSWATRNVAA